MTEPVDTVGSGQPVQDDEFLESEALAATPDEESGGTGLQAGPSATADKRIGVATAVLLIIVAVVLEQVAFDKEEIALGEATHRIYDSRVAGEPVRINEFPLLEFLEMLPGHKDLTVWVGNSHLHAINAYLPGDQLSSAVLHIQFNGHEVPGERPVFGLTFPNLRYEEQALLSMGLAMLPEEHRPKVIVHGIRFHDARERGVRADTRPLLKLPEIRQATAALDEERFGGVKALLEAGLQLAEESVNKEEGLEPWLVRNLGERLPIFRKRDYIYGRARWRLARLRDWVFRIDTTSKRPILPARYLDSMNALSLAVAFAEERGVEVLMYNSPMRASVANPYIAKEYQSFRRDLELLVESNGGTYKDYDPLIPEELWGTSGGTEFPDFSHFTGAGHVLLAKQIGADIEALLSSSGATPKQGASDAVQ